MPAADAPRTSTTFHDLEGLRGVAILLVLAAHAHVPGMRFGLFGVDIFFVLSGFLITRNLLSWTTRAATMGRAEVARRYATFLARRAVRLVPALAAVLVLLGLWSWLTRLEQGGRCAVLTATYTMNLPVADAATCPGPWHVVWSLAAEQQFYLVWPLCLLALAPLGRRGAPMVLTGYAVLVALVTAAALRLPEVAGWLNYAPLGRPLALLLGASVALAATLQPQHWAPAPRWALVGLLLGLVAIGSAQAAGIAPQVTLGPLVALGSAALIASLRRRASRIGRWLSAGWLTYVGRISYSLYLVHLLALYVARQLLPDAPLAATLAGLTAGVVGAGLLHRLVEEPARRRGNRAIAARTGAAAAPQQLLVAA